MKLKPYNVIGEAEITAAMDAMKRGPLSGYLGGIRKGGYYCEKLETEFAGIVRSKHAIVVNSATSGLLVACCACGVSRNSRVLTTPYTMSATAAAPKFLGADVIFGDIEDIFFSLSKLPQRYPDTIIITNMFGHPAYLQDWKYTARIERCSLIEDNAQSIFAMEDGKYAGTFGDIGVFSFNVHKHIHAGEGGICVTDSDKLADYMRDLRNHGELRGRMAGLNLRLTEVQAAIILSLLARRKEIISSRIEQAERLTSIVARYSPRVIPPAVREGCTHVYYCWPLLVEEDMPWFVDELNRRGFPIKMGYTSPLYMLPAFQDPRQDALPVVEGVEDRMVLFENCGWDIQKSQWREIEDIFNRVCEGHEKKCQQGTVAQSPRKTRRK